MTNSIRITKTKGITILLNELKNEFPALSEAEIVKMGLNRLYKEYKNDSLGAISKEGREIFSKWLKDKKKPKIDDLTEEQAYEIISED